MKRILLLIAIFLGLTTHAVSEPGPVERWLMDAPASLFSFGLHLTDLEVDKIAQEFQTNAERDGVELTRGTLATGSAKYEWDQNRVILEIQLWNIIDATEENCRAVLARLRSRGLINPTTGTYQFDGDHSSYVEAFLPIGYALKNEPENMLQRLDDIFVVRATLVKDYKPFRCRGPLVSNQVLIESY